jgi:hypothetical protein
LLYEDANKKDDNDLDRIRSEATAKETAGEGSAADGPSTSAATQTATESIAGPFGAINNVNVPLGGVIVNPNANLPPVGNNPIGVEARRLADRLRDPNLPRLQRNLYLRQLQQLQQQQMYRMQ